MNQEKRPVQEFEISDALWERIAPLLPEREAPFHPLGRHRQRIPDRKVLNSIFYVLRTGGQWKSLDVLDPSRYAKGTTSHARLRTRAFKNGSKPVFSLACGKRVCWTTTRCTV